MRVFIGGVMQASNHGKGIVDQGYRRRIAAALQARWPEIEIVDPFEIHPDSVEYDDPAAKETLFALLDLAAGSDLVIAYVPTASMGTALEMYRAYQAGVPVVTISPLATNWVVKACFAAGLSRYRGLRSERKLSYHAGGPELTPSRPIPGFGRCSWQEGYGQEGLTQMLVLHGSWIPDPGRFCFWAEGLRGGGGGRPVVRRRGRKASVPVHPFAATVEEVGAALAALLPDLPQPAAPVPMEAQLPSSGASPLPSPELMRLEPEWVSDDKPATLARGGRCRQPASLSWTHWMRCWRCPRLPKPRPRAR